MEREARALEAEAAAVEGLALSYEGELERADGRLRESVASARALGDDRVLALALGSLGFGLQKADRLDEARVAYDEARAAAERAGDAGSVATTRLNLASIAKTQGDLGNAISHLEAAVDMGRRSGRVATLRQALSNLANLELYLGRLARARVSIDALAAERAALAPHQRAQLLALEAEHAQRAGDLEAAATLCGECAEVYEQLGRAIDAAEAHLERALALAWQSDVPDRDVATAIERARALLAGGSAHRALLALAEARLAMRTPTQDGARERLDLALSAARAAGQRDLVWRALEARASLEQQAGASVTAARDREEAVAVLEEIAAPLPRDLREVYWSDPRRAALRAAHSSRRSDASASSLVTRAPTEDRLSRILEVNRAIAGETSLPRLLERVTDHAIALVRAERGFVLLRSGTSSSSSEPRGEPSSDLSVHAAGGDVGSDPHTRFSRSIAQEVLSTGAPVVTSSAASDERMAGYVSVHQLMLQSVACVPIRARSGLTIGALYLETRLRPAQSFEGELPTLLAFADQVAIAIETARLLGENERRRVELEATNGELERARARLEELLGHRTAQLKATRRDLRSARAVLKSHFGYQGLVGTSEAMRRVYSLIERIQDTDVPVLLTGESGTGKEMIARAIHHAGPRATNDPSWGSTAAPSPSTCSRASSSVTCAARSRAPIAIDAASSARPRAARCCSTRSARCRTRCRRASCACCKRSSCVPWAARAKSRSTRG
jgi:serine/threonine-protein kinase PknK